MRNHATRVQNITHRQPLRAGLPHEGDLQLLFARMNVLHFSGEVPAYRIVYNARLTSVAGRIGYRPPAIELSVPLLGANPDHLERTLLHEMVHAWLHARGLPSGHGRHFKRKMREVGLTSIYHALPVRRRRSTARYVLTCPRCAVELIRRRRPGAAVSCARCAPRGYDPRVRMKVRKIERERQAEAAARRNDDGCPRS
jgi:predicted SprT family Zn-dependent metalloprotease